MTSFFSCIFLLIISFQNIGETQEGQTARIRGFLYEVDGQKILASQPNLKTCCLGKEQTIAVEGSFLPPPSHQVVLIEGIIFKNQSRMVLSDAHIVAEKPNYWPIIAGISTCIGILATLLMKRPRNA